MKHSNNKSVVLKDFKHLLDLKYSGRTPANYLHHVGLFLDHCKNVPTRVNNEDVLDYNISIKDKGHSYKNVAINAIKAYFRLYLRKKINNFSTIRPPQRHLKPKVYDCKLMALKINAIPNYKHKAILALTLCCWLRKGELQNLKITDINGKLQQLHIKQSKGCKDRVLPISDNTLNLLRLYYLEYRPKEYLFEGINGKKYSASSLDKIVKKYLNPNMRFHAIRASAATYALVEGTDLKTVSEMLGHSRIETTKHYIPQLLKVHQSI
jgi:integrase/recombinase XerD